MTRWESIKDWLYWDFYLQIRFPILKRAGLALHYSPGFYYKNSCPWWCPTYVWKSRLDRLVFMGWAVEVAERYSHSELAKEFATLLIADAS